jgi:hypothetical protein
MTENYRLIWLSCHIRQTDCIVLFYLGYKLKVLNSISQVQNHSLTSLPYLNPSCPHFRSIPHTSNEEHSCFPPTPPRAECSVPFPITSHRPSAKAAARPPGDGCLWYCASFQNSSGSKYRGDMTAALFPD